MKVLRASEGAPWRAWYYGTRTMKYLARDEKLARYARPDIALMRQVLPGVWVGDIVSLNSDPARYVVRNDGLLEGPGGKLRGSDRNRGEVAIVGNIFEDLDPT